MKKVIPLIILALLVVPASVAFGSSSNASNIVKPSVVLIHGAWADGSSWSRVVSLLQTHGYTVYVPPNPLRGLTSDSAYIASFLQTITGPIILVEHSYGGAVITNAATGNPNVKALVYVDAFIPDLGEDILHLAGADSLIPQSIEFKGIPPFGPTDIDIYIKRDKFREAFAADIPPNETEGILGLVRESPSPCVLHEGGDS